MTQANLTCKELVELVTEYLEDAMPVEEKDRFEAHLGGCEGCRRYVEQMRQTIRLTGQLSEQDVSPEAERKLLDVFRDWKAGGD
jgi:predicted anti-sigma-YlaC factor YlaD